MTRLHLDVDYSHATQVRVVANMDRMSQGDTIVRALEEYIAPSGYKGVSVDLSEDLTVRATAAATTRGLTLEQLVAEAVDAVRSPKMMGRVEVILAFAGAFLLMLLPLLLLSLSPDIFNRSLSTTNWVLFGVAMFVGVGWLGGIAFQLPRRELEMTLRFGVLGVSLIVMTVILDISSLISGFAYLYWIISNMVPGFFNQPMSKVDALYFALNTFATTGTGSVIPQSGGAKLLVSWQVVLDFLYVVGALTVVSSRGLAMYRRRLERGVVVRRGPDVPYGGSE
jgi:hypothetical protein